MLATLRPTAGDAQEPRPFTWVRIGAGVARITPNFPPGDFWRPRLGPALRIETPLYPGTLALGAHLHSASAGRDADPAADPMGWSLLYMGWGRELTSRLLVLGAEVRVGTFLSSAPEAVGDEPELELLLGGAAWIRRSVGAGWSLRGELGAVRVYARHAWDPVSISVGVTRRVGLGRRIADAIAAPTPDDAIAAPRTVAVPRDLPDTPPSWWQSFPEVPAHRFGSAGVSTDRVDRLWSPGFLRAPEVGAPRYWLDGMPVRDVTLGGPAWPWLPLGSPDLAGVETLDRADVLAGRPELEGALSVTTRPPGRGPSVRGRAMLLNERGDAGPLRFTTLNSPNVDAPLYELDATAGYGWTEGWLTVSSVRRERWSLTRRELRDRNPAFTRGSSSRVRTDGASLGAAQRIGAVSIRARLWAGTGDRYVRAPSLGNELASDVDHRGGGLSLTLPATMSDSVRVYFAASSWETVSPNRRDAAADARALDWAESDYDVGVQYRATRDETTVVGGLDAARALDGLEGAGVARGSATAYGSVSTRTKAWLVTGGAEVGGGDRGEGAVVRVERSLGSHAWSGAAVSFRSGGRGGGLDVWDRGVEQPVLFSMLGLEASGVEARGTGRRSTARLEGGLRLDGWDAQLGLFVHRYRGERRPGVRYLWTDDVVTGVWGPLEAGEGRVLGISARWAWFRGDRLNARILLDAIRPSGAGAFTGWWSGAPRVRGGAEARLTLRPGWYLRGLVRARSAVTWAGLADVESRGAVSGGGRLPGALVGDVRMEGAILRGRIRLMVGVTNVFDHDKRMHPLGAGEARGLVLGLGSAVGGY